MFKVMFISIISFLLCSCGLSVIPVRTSVDVPAEINLVPYKKIKLTAENGKYAPYIVEQLSLVMEDSFQLVDKDYDAEIRVNCKDTFNADELEEQSITKTTRIDDGDRTDDSEVYKNEFLPADYEKTTRYTRSNVVELDVKFELVVSGEVLAVKEYKPRNVIKEEKLGSPPPPVEQEKAFHDTLYYVLREYSRATVPTKSYGQVRLQKIKHENFTSGVEFAKKGKWQQAMNVFDGIRLEENPDKETHAKNIYNYAVCLQFTANTVSDPLQRLQEAINMYEKAYATFPEHLYESQKQDCLGEIDRIKRLRKNEVK